MTGGPGGVPPAQSTFAPNQHFSLCRTLVTVQDVPLGDFVVKTVEEARSITYPGALVF